VRGLSEYCWQGLLALSQKSDFEEADMRFFPRDAFKNLSDTPVQIPVTQVPFQQFQQMQQFQQQMWNQIGMPMAATQVSDVDPMFLYKLQMLAQQKALAMQMALQVGPLWTYPQLEDPGWYLMDMGSYGYSGY
jgi:hypothetical protein